jgi:hypothetical protein
MPFLELEKGELDLLKGYYSEAADRLTGNNDGKYRDIQKALNLRDKIWSMAPATPIEFSHEDIKLLAVVVDTASGWHLVNTPEALSLEKNDLTQALQAKLMQANKT